MTDFELGDEVRDTVTGLKGVAIGWHKWFTGCDTVSIQPPIDKDGKVPDMVAPDVTRVVLVKKRVQAKDAMKTALATTGAG